MYVSFSSMDSGLYIYHLSVWSNLNFLHNSKWITLLTQSRPVLYSLCAILLYLLIMWLIVLSISAHLYICNFVESCLFCLHVVSPYGVVLCCSQERFSFSLTFPFCGHVEVFSCEISLACRLKCQYSCFSSHFCFLVIFVLLILLLLVLFLVAVVSLPPSFSM